MKWPAPFSIQFRCNWETIRLTFYEPDEGDYKKINVHNIVPAVNFHAFGTFTLLGDYSSLKHANRCNWPGQQFLQFWDRYTDLYTFSHALSISLHLPPMEGISNTHSNELNMAKVTHTRTRFFPLFISFSSDPWILFILLPSHSVHGPFHYSLHWNFRCYLHSLFGYRWFHLYIRPWRYKGYHHLLSINI